MLLEDAITSLPAHVRAGLDGSELAAIRLPSITMAVWERQLGKELSEAVRDVLASDFQDLRFSAEPDDIPLTLVERFSASGVGPRAVGPIATDIAGLSRRFAAIMDHPLLDIRVERVRGNACRKFHADYVTARLISTYSGRATEWLDQEQASRLASGSSPADLSIRSLRPGDVALLKGRLWAEEQAIVHRSPPIAGTGEERLLLVINPVENETGRLS